MLLNFMTIHLFQFRFGDTSVFGPYYIRPPRYLINFQGIFSLDLFWTKPDTDGLTFLFGGTAMEKVGVRDIYALEYQIFKNPLWATFYICCVGVFVTHACLGWKKAIPVLGIPKLHHPRVEVYGYLIFVTLGLIYVSFPVYCMATSPFVGHEVSIQEHGH